MMFNFNPLRTLSNDRRTAQRATQVEPEPEISCTYDEPLWIKTANLEQSEFPVSWLPTLGGIGAQVVKLEQLLDSRVGYFEALPPEVWRKQTHHGSIYRALWAYRLSPVAYIAFEDLFGDYRQAKKQNRCWAALFVTASFATDEPCLKVAVLKSENRLSGGYDPTLDISRLKPDQVWVTPLLVTKLLNQIHAVQTFETQLAEMTRAMSGQ